MKIIHTHFIPFKGFLAMNLFGLLLVRKSKADKVDAVTINHEAIHTAQMRDFCKWLPIGGTIFYILYFFEWVCRIFIPSGSAYRNISFEIEAYNNHRNEEYLATRKRFAMWRHH